MEIDPHTIQQILLKVREQLRCPQCTRKLEVTFDSLKVLSNSFAVFQLQCLTCNAYIMLYATVRGQRHLLEPLPNTKHNFSTEITLEQEELQALQKCLEKADGSFSTLFKTTS
jgi:hypothetical protein